MTMGNVTIQMDCDPKMRGRVMALWTVAMMGTTPIGGPIIGWIGQNAGPRVGLVVGGVAALVGAFYGWVTLKPDKLIKIPKMVWLRGEELTAEEETIKR